MLMTASRTGNVEAMRVLLAHGADPNAQESWYGETALMWAAAENHAPAVRLLLEGGAKVDLASKKMVFPRKVGGQTTLPVGAMTPLMYTARQGALDAARALVEGGADLNIQDPDGTTAMVFAIINGHYDVAAMLAREGRRSQPRRFERHGRPLRGGRHEHVAVHARTTVPEAVGPARRRGHGQGAADARRRRQPAAEDAAAATAQQHQHAESRRGHDAADACRRVGRRDAHATCSKSTAPIRRSGRRTAPRC